MVGLVAFRGGVEKPVLPHDKPTQLQITYARCSIAPGGVFATCENAFDGPKTPAQQQLRQQQQLQSS